MEKRAERLHLARQRVDHDERRACDLRHHDDDERNDGRQGDEHRKRDGKPAHEGPGGRKAQPAAAEREDVLEAVAHGREQVGDHEAVHEGHEDAADGVRERRDVGQVEDDVGQHKADADGAHARDAGLDVPDVRWVFHAAHPLDALSLDRAQRRFRNDYHSPTFPQCDTGYTSCAKNARPCGVGTA